MPAVNNATPEPIVVIAWGDFKVAMLSDPAYARVSEATVSEAPVRRIEIYFSTEVENWSVAQLFWGQMIRGCSEEQRPSEAEVERWNQIAESTKMPITFISEGFLTPKTED